jgi:hypothetical protein
LKFLLSSDHEIIAHVFRDLMSNALHVIEPCPDDGTNFEAIHWGAG